jgi:ABC-type spermidine/putrescine transport system permease subunit II
VSAGRRERAVVAGIGGLAIAFLLLPMVVVALASLNRGEFFTFPPDTISLHWYGEFLGDSDWTDALFLSLKIAGLTAVAATVIGGLAGIAIARCPSGVRPLLYALLVAPLTVPPIVIAISLYPLALESHLVGSMAAFVAANTILTTPIVALLTVGAALSIDERVEYASLSCGAGRTRTLLRVTLPAVLPAALAGGVLAFLLTLDEVVISVFLVAPGRTPLAVKMFLEVQSASPAVVTAAATLLIGVTIVVIGGLTLARTLSGRRSGAAVPLTPTPGGPVGP